MKTPDEIKKGLECCTPRDYENLCRKCPYSRDDSSAECIADLEKDALAYIQQLESRLAQVERERDAAIRDCAMFPCSTCADRENGDLCYSCHVLKDTTRSNYEWRGVCEENTKEK